MRRASTSPSTRSRATWHAKAWRSWPMRHPRGGRCYSSGRHSRTSSWPGSRTWRRTGKPTVSRCAPPANCLTSPPTTESEEHVTINLDRPSISARAVSKSFGDHVVLDSVDLTVAEGSVFSLLGPNGAGKTTMVRILSTLIRADGGDIRVGGNDVGTDPD